MMRLRFGTAGLLLLALAATISAPASAATPEGIQGVVSQDDSVGVGALALDDLHLAALVAGQEFAPTSQEVDRAQCGGNSATALTTDGGAGTSRAHEVDRARSHEPIPPFTMLAILASTNAPVAARETDRARSHGAISAITQSGDGRAPMPASEVDRRASHVSA